MPAPVRALGEVSLSIIAQSVPLNSHVSPSCEAPAEPPNITTVPRVMSNAIV